MTFIAFVLPGTLNINESELRALGYLFLMRRVYSTDQRWQRGVVASRIEVDVAGSNPSWVQDFF